jgi:hypothetical protein
MPLPPDVELFTKTIAWQDDRIILTTSLRLEKSIESCWRARLAAHPKVEDERMLVELLVEDLFDLLHDRPVDFRVQQHWVAFLADLALKVASRLFKIVSNNPEDAIEVQSICLAMIAHPDRFFRGFDRQFNSQADLLSSLKGYGYNTIKYSAYPEIRKTFNNPNIGRSLLSLFNHYSDRVIRQSLVAICTPPSQIDRDLCLGKCAREYLRQTGKRINQLQSLDFDRIGNLYHEITGDLSPPVEKRLEEIGRAISRYTSPSIISNNTPIGNDADSNFTLEDTLESPHFQPVDLLEIQEREQKRQRIFDICDRWVTENTNAHKRCLLLLRYGFALNQTQIGCILELNQSNISLPLRQIHSKIAQAIVNEMNADPAVTSTTAIEWVIKVFQENFSKFDVIQQIDRATIQALITLMGELKIWLKQKENRSQPLEPLLVTKIRGALKDVFL